MKVIDLVKELEKYSDFDVKYVFSEVVSDKDKFPTIRTFDITGIGDIGHSDKVILLEGVEK